jgi:hypothetical protein
MSMRAFGLVYYAAVAVTLAAVACLPWLVPLSYRVLGFAPQPARSGTYAAFQAQLATAALRRGFLGGMLSLALSLVALSLVALILRLRRRTTLPWPVLAPTTVGAAGVAVVALAGLVMSGGGMCC